MVVIVVVVMMQVMKKEAGVGICFAMADCSTYSVNAWIYRDPSVSPSALGSCCSVVEGESHSICTSSVWTELYQECIQPITYPDFTSYKNSYLIGGSISTFISDANQCVIA